MASQNFKNLSTLIFGACLLGLVSCDGGSSSSSSGNGTIVEAQEQGDPGIYRVVLTPVNAALAGETNGTIEIQIDGDDVVVKGTVANAPAGVKHLQNVMTGNRCPDMSADTNGDGIIDGKEAQASYGQILIPLDSNLSEQIAGMEFGPIANSEGTYVYRRSTTLSMMLSDLHAPDPDVEDHIAKLPAGDDLRLAGRVVVVHGVSGSAALADTVGTVGNLTPAQALPIACGKLVRIVSEEAL